MFYWAVLFFLTGMIAGILSYSGVVGISANVICTLFAAGFILFLVFLLFGQRRSTL